jgi:hypothetical protein
MSRVLSVAGEGFVVFGRRPVELYESDAPRRLAANAAAPYRFGYARTALKYGLKSIGLQPGDGLLVPDLTCDSGIEPLHELGIEPQYYPVDSTLEPAWGALEQLVTRSTKGLLVVHYFGQPQRLPECIGFCRKYALTLIEDNAHGFGARLDGQLLGTFGDLGVSAPRKSFPIRNGAYLYAATSRTLDLSALRLQPSSVSSWPDRIKRRIKEISFVRAVMKGQKRGVEYRRRLGPPPPYGSQDAFRDPPIPDDYGMDESTESFFARQDMEHVRKVRHQVYALWHGWTATQGLTPVFPKLSPEAMPLVFPAYTASAAASLQWYERGHRAGIDIHSWPTLPRSVVAQDGSAMRQSERMVCFPIHQQMNVGLLERRLALL